MIRRLAAAVLRRALPSAEIPRAPEAPPPDDRAAGTRIAELVAAHRVVLFMKGDPVQPQCGFSARTAAVLAGMGVDFAHVDVLADPAMREGVKAYSEWPTLPQLFVDGDFVGGADIVEEMAAEGSLAELLGVSAEEPPPVAQTAPEEVARWLDDGETFLLLDVRTDQELELASLTAARQLRTEDFPELEALPRDTRIAFLCHHGIRSQAAANAFRALGFTDLHNIVGGIDAWSHQVDPSVPRY
jgi:Grx4 family monothiol glutaredoxin